MQEFLVMQLAFYVYGFVVRKTSQQLNRHSSKSHLSENLNEGHKKLYPFNQGTPHSMLPFFASILMVSDSRTKSGIDMLQLNFLAADVIAELISLGAFIRSPRFRKAMLFDDINHSLEQKSMPCIITQRELHLQFDFNTQLLKEHVCRALNKCRTTVVAVFK